MTLLEFHTIVDNTIGKLRVEASTTPAQITALNTGEKFQNHVKDLVSNEVNAIDPTATIINRVSKAFPDIVIECSDGTKYGIEVKSSSDNSAGWETPGNSINESTLVPGLIEIQLVFGKTHPARHAFRSAVYSDCVKTIKTTHYPRFIVDMDISPAQTIFAQMGTTFSAFSSLSDKTRLQKIKDFYISKGEYYWWLTDDAENAIRLFENLDSATVNAALAYGYVHFPEEVSNSSKKYERLAKYIAAELGAVSTSLRDRVSAGGRANLTTSRRTYPNVPRIYINMYRIRNEIQRNLDSSKLSALQADWSYTPSARRKKTAWIEVMNLKATDCLNDADRKMLLEDIINIP